MRKTYGLLLCAFLGVSGCGAAYVTDASWKPNRVVEVDGYKLNVALNEAECEAYVAYMQFSIGPDFHALGKAAKKAAEAVSQCEATDIYRPEDRRVVWVVSLECN